MNKTALQLLAATSLIIGAEAIAMPETNLLADAQPSGVSVGYDNGFRIANDKASLTLNAQIQAGASYVDVDQGDNDFNFDIFSARLEASGDALGGKVSYMLEYDFVDGEQGSDEDGGALLDGWAQINFSDHARLRIGQTRAPYSRQQLAEGYQLLTTKRSLVTEILAPGRDRGAMFHGASNKAGYAIGVFNGEGQNVVADDTDLLVSGQVWLNLGDYGSRIEESDLRDSGQLAGTIGLGSFYAENEDQEIFSINLDAGLRVEGFSLNSEVHWQSRDNDLFEEDVVGVLAQVGYNLGAFELGYQFSTIGRDELEEPTEHTIVGTHYLNGHWSKLQLGVTLADNTVVDGGSSEDDIRVDFIFTQRL